MARTEDRKRKIFVTSALPYANGSIHLGHLVEYLQTDIWVRFQKLMGQECLYCCADDAHGTPMMVAARKKKVPVEELIAECRAEHVRDFAAFQIEFDSYHTTHSDENRALSEEIFARNVDGGHITFKDVELPYCEEDGMFLPDRLIRGTCPRCGAEDQYGDQCEICNAPYSQTELKDPRCSLCGSTPQIRKSRHAFFKLSDFAELLDGWIDVNVNPEIARELRSKWLEPGLRDWDFTRDAPYFGFEVPGHEGLYFYVWWDAPIGYYASLTKYLAERNLSLDDWLDDDVEIHHFIGKDIAYHHGIYWPAMLSGAGFRLPRIRIHGFLTVNGLKMSKSRGTFVNAKTYLKYLDPLYVRYYYACKLGADSVDIDLNLDDFATRVNSDLVGKIANIPSRSAQMLMKKLGGKLGRVTDEGSRLLECLRAGADRIASFFDACEYSKATREICALADEVNRHIDDKKPWNMLKTDPDAARDVLTDALNATKILSIYLKPILPSFVTQIEALLGTGDLEWNDLDGLLEETEINEFSHLVNRVDKKNVQAMVDETRSAAEAAAADSEPAEIKTPLDAEPLAEECTFDDFMKVDLRVGKVLEAAIVEGADRLINLKIDIGGEIRNVLAGIRSAYEPETLVGRHVVVAANLKPRKMKFGTSEGMVLAAGPGGKEIFVISADDGAEPGMRVH